MCLEVSGLPLDILRFPSVLEYVAWFLAGWKSRTVSLCREEALLSISHSEEGRNGVLQAQAELPVHWQKKSALVSMAAQLHGSHYSKEAKYICLYFDFFHTCHPCGSFL